MTGGRRVVSRFFFRIAVPALLAVVTMVAVVNYTLGRMAGEVDRIDAGHLARASRAALHDILNRIASTTRDYAVWDDAARSLYGTIDPRFVQDNLIVSTRQAELFDTAIVLEPDGRMVAGYRLGAPLASDAKDRFGDDLLLLIGRLDTARRNARPSSGFLDSPDGLVAAALSTIEPASPELDRTEPVRLLLLAKDVSSASIDTAGAVYAIDGLKMTGGDVSGGVPVLSPSGRTLATLTWKPRGLGRETYDSAFTAMMSAVAILLLILGFLLLVIWQALRDVRNGAEAARRAARTDALSGLANRAAFNEELTVALAENGRLGVTVMFLDLDGFKNVNDTYGHEIGDRLIRAVAAGFHILTEEKGLLARLGGDEFAALLTGKESLREAMEIGAQMIDFLSQPFDFEGRLVQVGTSVGVAHCGPTLLSPVELVRRADVAMYEAKSRGKNRVEVYAPEMDTERAERAELANALRHAFESGGLQVHYQPVVDARSGEMVAVEALLRWFRPGFGSVPPPVFIPLAEETGLMERLGAWVLRQVCRDARGWGRLRVAVNVAGSQFRNPRFPDEVERILAEEGFPAGRLELDITESHLVRSPERAQRAIKALQGMGVEVSLDDFGTGFSSIGYLRRFGFSRVKIDRSVVIDVLKDPASRKLVESTVALADALGVVVTAEGIERPDEAAILRSAGCHELQGYHFSSPVSAAQVGNRLATRSVAGTGPVDLRISA